MKMRKTWPGGPNARTRTHGEAHIKEAAFGRPPPFVDSFIWVSPWLRVRVFGPPGQVFHVSMALMWHFAYGFLSGYRALEH